MNRNISPLVEWFCLRCGYREVRHRYGKRARRTCPKCGGKMKCLPVRDNPPRYIV